MQNGLAENYRAITIEEMQNSIIANVLAGNYKEAIELTTLFSGKGDQTIPRLN